MVNIDWAYENVLVTGATGFVGGNLAAELVRRGAHVVTVERDRRAVNSLKALGIYDQVSVAFGDEDIWDIGAIAAFFALSNRMANLTAMRPNDEFYLMGRLPRGSSS